jgi:hypothetical protein
MGGAMVSSEVQRTLVKSPPELWAELSDPSALARHLGELGEIRITRVEPEQKVEWEAEETSGTVLIDPSGWGTRVTLKVTREIPAPDSQDASGAPAHAEATLPAQPEAALSADPEHSASFEDESEGVVAIDREPVLDSELGQAQELAQPPEPEPARKLEPEQEHHELELELEPALAEPALEDAFMAELEPRRGFFARMFRRHRAIARPGFESGSAGRLEQSPEPADAFAAVRRELAPETFAAAHPFATTHMAAPTQQEPARVGAAAQRADDTPAEITTAEDIATEEVTAVLTSVLDRLGAAHHRPFSRA